ncbi:MAG: hypothetical protein ABI794_06690 [Betaproteobacteria bacterium]
MKRAALERPRTLNTWRQHVVKHGDLTRCVCEVQAGRFRKSQRAGGCGRPRCWLCHGDKLGGLPTIRVRKGQARYREGLAEIA